MLVRDDAEALKFGYDVIHAFLAYAGNRYVTVAPLVRYNADDAIPIHAADWDLISFDHHPA